MQGRRAILKKIMQSAWSLARQGARRFGGSPSAYFICSLRLSWEDLRSPKENAQTLWHPERGNQFILSGVDMPCEVSSAGEIYLPGICSK